MLKPMVLTAITCLVALVLGTSWHPARADVTPLVGKYWIKGHPMKDSVTALTQLHRFLSTYLEPEERCRRDAVLLDMLNREGKVSSFKVAGIARMKDVWNDYKKIGVVRRRDLFIAATKQYLGRNIVDSSMVELVTCIESEFFNRDLKARSFLNNGRLREVIEQYKSIAEQPVRLLAEGRQHPKLRESQLDKSIENSVMDWISNDKELFKKIFSDHQVEEKAAPPVATTEAEANAIKNDAVASTEAAAQPEAKATQEDGVVASMEAAAEPEAKATGTGDPVALEAEEQEHMNTIFASLIAVYKAAPFEFRLSDRCTIYDRIISAERNVLYSDTFLDNIMAEIKPGSSSGPPKPVDKVRDNFFFVMELFNSQIAPVVWLDLDKCITKWIGEDEYVKAYIENEVRIKIKADIEASFPKPDQENPGEV